MSSTCASTALLQYDVDKFLHEPIEIFCEKIGHRLTAINRSNTSFLALGNGGNSVTFSRLAAEILTDLLMGKENKDAKIDSFDERNRNP